MVYWKAVTLNAYPADHDYCRFLAVLLVDCYWEWNVCLNIKICKYFSYLKL